MTQRTRAKRNALYEDDDPLESIVMTHDVVAPLLFDRANFDRDKILHQLLGHDTLELETTNPDNSVNSVSIPETPTIKE